MVYSIEISEVKYTYRLCSSKFSTGSTAKHCAKLYIIYQIARTSEEKLDYFLFRSDVVVVDPMNLTLVATVNFFHHY
jgi:hypothetical protein